MAEWALTIEPREPGRPRRDRAAGYVPAVVYGRGRESEAVRIAEKALRDFLAAGGHHHVVTLRRPGDGQALAAVVKEIQRDPVRGRVLHVDFQAVSQDTRIRARVPVVVHGEEQVEKAGAVVQHQLHELEIECLPADLPERIDVDVRGLAPGESVHVRDLVPPKGVEILEDEDAVVASVVIPRAVEAALKAEEGGAEAEAPASPDSGGA